MGNLMDGDKADDEGKRGNVPLDKGLIDDGIPYACHICRNAFQNPVVTNCQHYFCESCIMGRYAKDASCPVCSKDTGGVFNHPQKLYAKRKKVLGRRDGDWI